MLYNYKLGILDKIVVWSLHTVYIKAGTNCLLPYRSVCLNNSIRNFKINCDRPTMLILVFNRMWLI